MGLFKAVQRKERVVIVTIIVEGADNTGKTTLVDQLANVFPVLERRKSPGPSPTLSEWITHELLVRTGIKIYDRFFLSELVYGPILRGKACFSGAEQSSIFEMLRTVKPLTIICVRSTEELLETANEREQMGGVVENLERIQKAYINTICPLLTENKLPYLSYYFDEDGAYSHVVNSVGLRIQRIYG